MLSGMQKNNVKVASITLVLAFIMIAEPVLAEEKRSDSGKSGGSSIKSEQARNVSTSIHLQRPLNVIKPPANIAPVTASSRPQTSNSKFPPKAGTMPSLQPGGPTLSRTPALQRQSSFGTGRLPGGGTPTGMSSSIAGATAVGSGNRISLDRGPSIVSSTNQESSFVITQREPAAASSTNRFSQSRTSQIGSLIGTRSLSTATIVKRPTIGADNRAGSDRTLHIGSPRPDRGQETSLPILAKPPTRSGAAADQRKDITRDWIGGSRTRLGEAPSRSQISSVKTSRLGSVLGEVRSSVSNLRNQSPRLDRGPNSHISSDRIQHLGSLIGKERTSSPIMRKLTRGDEPKRSIAQTGQNHNSPQGRTDRIAETSRTHKDINLKSVDRLQPSSRPPRENSKFEIRNSRFPPKVGEHLPVVKYTHRYEHVYWDSHHRLCHRIVWPTYRFALCYSHGPFFTFRYVYPYYLRRYIFVSLGGYWPVDYTFIRYYWYGCHPYTWYGYYPIGYEVKGDTYNYYTYNYYYNDDNAVPTVSSQVADGIKPVDHNTFADVREKLAQQATKEPHPETLADTQFDEAVKAFEAGSYEMAIEKFAEVSVLASDDMVLPFAYTQAFFANEQYSEAAKVLRAALAKVSPEKEGVFYPRGLYPDDDVLFEQIEHLRQKTKAYSFDADLQLLLGYQLLGIGETEAAIEPLQRASQDFENAAAATTLLDLLAKIKTDTN